MNRGGDPQPHANRDVPGQVRALEGTYTGAWTEYGIDDEGEVVRRMAWTDTMKAGRPEVTRERAYVATTDEMTFEGAQEPPLTIKGKEGFYLTEAGGLGDYFIETGGQIHRLARLGDNVWTFAALAAEQELAHLGFCNGAFGQHVVVKVVTTERGVETHRVSRVTTVRWEDTAGNERALQFVSLRGYHQRQP